MLGFSLLTIFIDVSPLLPVGKKVLDLSTMGTMYNVQCTMYNVSAKVGKSQNGFSGNGG